MDDQYAVGPRAPSPLSAHSYLATSRRARAQHRQGGPRSSRRFSRASSYTSTPHRRSGVSRCWARSCATRTRTRSRCVWSTCCGRPSTPMRCPCLISTTFKTATSSCTLVHAKVHDPLPHASAKPHTRIRGPPGRYLGAPLGLLHGRASHQATRGPEHRAGGTGALLPALAVVQGWRHGPRGPPHAWAYRGRHGRDGRVDTCSGLSLSELLARARCYEVRDFIVNTAERCRCGRLGPCSASCSARSRAGCLPPRPARLRKNGPCVVGCRSTRSRAPPARQARGPAASVSSARSCRRRSCCEWQSQEPPQSDRADRRPT
jgi:hypothetical protein